MDRKARGEERLEMELRVSVEKSFRNFLLGADFTVQGERVGVFGPSGSGKSTLVGLIAGLVRPDKGAIILDGETLFDSDAKVNVRSEERRMGMVFQRPSLFPHLSVKGNLLYGYKRCAPVNRNIAFDAVVEVLKLGSLLDRGVRHLSGGEKQRVAIGRAVLGNPRLLLLDEPLSALDDNLKFQIVPFLKNVCKTFTIPYLFISHSLLEMRIMTDQVLQVIGGRVVEETTAENLVRARIGASMAGYINLVRLSAPRQVDALYAYNWGDQQLITSSGDDEADGLFELSSTDIMLFKSHPEAISARNLLKCRVTGTFDAGNRIGVDLECNGDSRLVAEVVKQAAEELGIKAGAEVYAAIKATAFRKLG
jgi:molybdate transport system ATP-binding protein